MKSSRAKTTKRYYNFPRIWHCVHACGTFKVGRGAGGSTSLSVSDPVKTRYIYILYLSWSRQFCPVDPRYTSVIHQFPCRFLSVIVRCTCGQCPAHHRFTRWLSCRSPGRVSGPPIKNRMRTDKYRTGNARVPTKTHAQRTITVQPADAFGRWCPFQVLSMPKTFHRIKWTSPDKERIRRTRNGQETHANGLQNLLSVGRTVNAVCMPSSFVHFLELLMHAF